MSDRLLVSLASEAAITAAAAAREQGQSIGEWLEQAIADQAASQTQMARIAANHPRRVQCRGERICECEEPSPTPDTGETCMFCLSPIPSNRRTG